MYLVVPFCSFCWLQISMCSTVNWLDNPDGFLAIFLNCIRDEHCHFFYWHIAKTGGTTMSYNMRQKFPDIYIRNTCCGEKAVQNFNQNLEAYCHSKFSSWEVNGKDLRMIVDTCTKLNPNSSSIIMFTYREPTSRFISWINHMCNKRVGTRSVEWQTFCERCTNTPDGKALLEPMAHKQNEIYLSETYITEMRKVPVLALDTMDLSQFLKTLSLQSDFPEIFMSRNTGNTRVCDFAITSEIVEELAPSIGVYRNLTRGVY